MSITFDPTIPLYAVVEHLKSTKHLYDSVDHKPEHDGQFRLVCLAPNADDAARMAHLLRAMDDGTYWRVGRTVRCKDEVAFGLITLENGSPH